MPSPVDPPSDALQYIEDCKVAERYQEALSLLENLLTLHPDHVLLLEEIADTELSLNHYDRAEVAAKRALALDDESYTGHYIIGFIASHRREWASSVASLKQANHLHPNHPEILRCLGWSLFNAGEETAGIVTLERSLNIQPDNTFTLCDLGVVCLQMQNFSKARALFSRAVELEPESERAKDCLHMVERFERMYTEERRSTTQQ